MSRSSELKNTVDFYEEGRLPTWLLTTFEQLEFMMQLKPIRFFNLCQVDEQPCKRSKKNGYNIAVAILKKTRHLGCVFQDIEPPKCSSILRKRSNLLKPIRSVRFTKAVVRHAHIRDQNPLLGMICPGDPHQRNPDAPKFEDRSQEETEWQ